MSLVLAPIDSKDVWESFLAANAPESLFQSWYWGDVLQKSGSLVERFGFFDGPQLVGIAQLVITRAKRGTFLHVRHGPVWKGQSQGYWVQGMKLLTQVAAREKAWFIRISPLLPVAAEHLDRFRQLGLRPSPIHEVDAERCWVLDIEASEEALLMNMRKTTRYEIRLAQKSDVRIETSIRSKDLDSFYRLYEETSRRHGFVAHESITEEFEVFSKAGNALLYIGYEGSQVRAAAIVLFYGSQAIYHHGASVTGKVPVSRLIQWEAILEAKKRGKKVYNFYGIAPEDKPNHPWRGITLFKKGFGGREVNYIHSHDLPLSPLYMISYVIERTRTKLRGY